MCSSTHDNPIVIESDREPKFTLFPKLPIELRDIIWKYAASEPRFIKIMYTGEDDSDSYSDEDAEFNSDSYSTNKNEDDYPRQPIGLREESLKTFYKFKTTRYIVPSILRTNKESREVGNSIYHMSFERELGGSAIWVDFARDIIFFDHEYTLLAFLGIEKPDSFSFQEIRDCLPDQVTYMGSHLKQLALNASLYSVLLMLLPRFESLEKVVLRTNFRFANPLNFNGRLSKFKERWHKAAEKRGFSARGHPQIQQLSWHGFNEKFSDSETMQVFYLFLIWRHWLINSS
jgi:hypothetical protein